MDKSSLQEELPHDNQQPPPPPYSYYDHVEELQLEVSHQPERGFIYPTLYFYANFWSPKLILNNLLSSRHRRHPSFQPENTDVIVASKPKSGTTWLKSLAFAILNRDKHAVVTAEDHLTHPLASTNPHVLVTSLEFNLLSPERSLLFPIFDGYPRRLYGTHLPYHALPDSVKYSGCRIVYVCRNPLDALVSDWKFCCREEETEEERESLNKLDKMVDSCCRGVEPFGPHWVSVLGYWKESLENPRRVLFVRYEELKRDEVSNVKRLAEFLGVPFALEEEEKGVVEGLARLCSLGSLKEFEVNRSGEDFMPHLKNHKFFRKGDVGDSLNYLSPAQVDRLTKVFDEKFRGSGFEV